MGAVGNAVTNSARAGKIGSGLGRGINDMASGSMNKLVRTSVKNLDVGSRACPIIG